MNNANGQAASIRAFIAVGVPDSIRSRLEDLHSKLRRLDADVKWVRPGSMHLTLRFLGDIPAGRVDEVQEAMDAALKDVSPVEIEIGGSGAFPNSRRPRVYWLGIKGGAPELEKMFGLLDPELFSRGFGHADKRFSAHLTLGRVRSGRGSEKVAGLLEREAAGTIGSFTASRVVLYRSELRPEGAKYTSLRETLLRGG